MRWPSAWWISTLSLHIISHAFLGVFLRVLNRKGNHTFERSPNRHWTTRNFCKLWYTRQESTAVPLEQIWLQGPSTSAASLRVTSDPPSCSAPGVATGSPGRRPSNGVAPKPGAIARHDRWWLGNYIMMMKKNAMSWWFMFDKCCFMIGNCWWLMVHDHDDDDDDDVDEYNGKKHPFAGWPWIYWTIYGTLHTADTSAAIFFMCQIDLFPVLKNGSSFLYQGAGWGR